MVMSSGLRGRDLDVRQTPLFAAAASILRSEGSPSWYAHPLSLYLHRGAPCNVSPYITDVEQTANQRKWGWGMHLQIEE